MDYESEDIQTIVLGKETDLQLALVELEQKLQFLGYYLEVTDANDLDIVIRITNKSKPIPIVTE